VVGGAVLVVGFSHLSAGGSSVLPLSVDSSPPFQWATAMMVTSPVVPAARSNWPWNWFCPGPKLPESRFVTPPLTSEKTSTVASWSFSHAVTV
jgi:hypothetical protein